MITWLDCTDKADGQYADTDNYHFALNRAEHYDWRLWITFTTKNRPFICIYAYDQRDLKAIAELIERKGEENERE